MALGKAARCQSWFLSLGFDFDSLLRGVNEEGGMIDSWGAGPQVEAKSDQRAGDRDQPSDWSECSASSSSLVLLPTSCLLKPLLPSHWPVAPPGGHSESCTHQNRVKTS